MLKKTKRMSEKQKEQQKRARRAAIDLDGWKSMFRIGSLTIATEADCRKQVSYVRNMIAVTLSPDHVSVGRELSEVASFVRSESISSSYPRELCGQIVDGLLRAAECEKDPMISCPWRQCLEKIRSRPRMLALGKSLWTMNPEGRREWAIDLDALKREVWGEEKTSISTVSSMVSELSKQLGEAEVPLTLSISDTHGNHRLTCALPSDFDFDVSW